MGPTTDVTRIVSHYTVLTMGDGTVLVGSTAVDFHLGPGRCKGDGLVES